MFRVTFSFLCCCRHQSCGYVSRACAVPPPQSCPVFSEYLAGLCSLVLLVFNEEKGMTRSFDLLSLYDFFSLITPSTPAVTPDLTFPLSQYLPLPLVLKSGFLPKFPFFCDTVLAPSFSKHQIIAMVCLLDLSLLHSFLSSHLLLFPPVESSFKEIRS